MASPPSSLLPAWVWHHSQRAAAGLSPWAEAESSTALCFHLNFHGEAVLSLADGHQILVKPQTLIWCRGPVAASRTHTRDRHECLTLAFPDPWLTTYLEEIAPQIPFSLQSLVIPPGEAGLLPGRTLSGEDLAWARGLMMSCLSESVRRMLDTVRLADFLLIELFSPSPSASAAPALISRSERAVGDRVEKVKTEILNSLDENHSLESLALAAGCSPHYLSRTFSQATGVPLMLWIRRVRIDRAAELIASGRCNVSEAAVEVGYKSFSHFSRAFHQEKGVSPSKWVPHLASGRGSNGNSP